MIDETVLAWAAGFFDGEGSINIVRQAQQNTGRKYHSLVVNVNQCDPRPLQYLQEYWSGNIRMRTLKNPNHRDVYVWVIRTKQAETFLRDIRPFLRVKDHEADIAIAFREIKANGGRYQGVDLAAHDSKESFKAQLEGLRKKEV